MGFKMGRAAEYLRKPGNARKKLKHQLAKLTDRTGNNASPELALRRAGVTLVVLRSGVRGAGIEPARGCSYRILIFETFFSFFLVSFYHRLIHY
jgi:hypothetical protein